MPSKRGVRAPPVLSVRTVAPDRGINAGISYSSRFRIAGTALNPERSAIRAEPEPAARKDDAGQAEHEAAAA